MDENQLPSFSTRGESYERGAGWTRRAIMFNKPLTRACCRVCSRACRRIERWFAVRKTHGWDTSRSGRLQLAKGKSTEGSNGNKTDKAAEDGSFAAKVRRELRAR